MGSDTGHGNKSASTSFLLHKLINEETLPDHLLSTESEVRKKRDAKKFFSESIYIAVFEAFRIYKEIIEVMESIAAEVANRPAENTNKAYLDYLYQMQKITAPQRVEDNHSKLVEAKENYRQFHQVLDAKIIAIQQMITVQKQTLVNLKNESVAIREALAQAFNAHIGKLAADPDFVALQIAITVSPEEKISVEISKQAYTQLLQSIATGLNNGSIAAHKLTDYVLEKSNRIIEDNMRQALKDFNPDIREQIIHEQKTYFTATLANQVWHDVTTNPTLASKLEDMYHAERAMKEAEIKLALCESSLDSLLDIRQKADQQMAAIDNLLAMEPGTGNMDVLNKNGMSIEALNAQMSDIDSLLQSDLNYVVGLHVESDSLLQEVAAVKQDALAIAEKDPEALTAAIDNVHAKTEQLVEKYRPEREVLQVAGEENQDKISHKV